MYHVNEITLMRWKTSILQQKTTIFVGLCLIFTTSNYLDGMENINSPIYNYNSCNFNKRKSLLFGSLYFHLPPPIPPPIPHPPQWDDSILCLPVVILLAHLVFVAGVDHFLGGTGDQLSVLHELSGFGHCSVLTLTLLHKTIKNISIYIINTCIINSTSPSNCFHNNHLLIYHR